VAALVVVRSMKEQNKKTVLVQPNEAAMTGGGEEKRLRLALFVWVGRPECCQFSFSTKCIKRMLGMSFVFSYVFPFSSVEREREGATTATWSRWLPPPLLGPML